MQMAQCFVHDAAALLARARKRRTETTSDFVSHSHITITRHPSARSFAVTRSSRATFAANLSDQNFARVLGVDAFVQFG